MRTLAAVPFGVAGCMVVGPTPSTTGTTASPTCGEVPDIVETTDDQLGFSAVEVLESLPRRGSVDWGTAPATGISDAPDEDPVTFSRVALVGSVCIADLPADWPPTESGTVPHLVLPVAVDITIGDGQVVASGTLELHAAGVESGDIRTWSEYSGLPATLSGDYERVFDDWWDDERDASPDLTDWKVEGIFALPYGTWSERGLTGLGLDVLYENSVWSSAAQLWDGTVVLAE